MQIIISDDKTLLEAVKSLTEPINNCRAVLEQISVKLEKLRNSCLESYIDHMVHHVNLVRGTDMLLSIRQPALRRTRRRQDKRRRKKVKWAWKRSRA